MKASMMLYAFLRDVEGLRLKPYPDGGGLLTCGYGHLLRPGEAPNGCTEAQAERWLVEDIQQAEESYTRLVKIPLEQHEADAVLSWIFNVGEEKIQHNGTNSLRLLNSGNREGFSDILLKWNKVRVNGELVESKGLTARRKKERAMFLGEVVHGG